MVESMCEQGFAYTHEVEEERLEKLVKLGQNTTRKKAGDKIIFLKNYRVSHRRGRPFIGCGKELADLACKPRKINPIWYRSKD
jgi:hypothetical protein